MASSFQEFWRRWHMTLSRWLRDYLYISLGGNRNGLSRTMANLMTTMVLGGLWHGASWNFVIWGALHGAYLALERMLLSRMAWWRSTNVFAKLLIRQYLT
jgi:alginate O-acetyltransferase complex protein AlgI